MPPTSAVAILLTTLASQGAPERVDYNRDIRPILAQNCFASHGFDGSTRKAGLHSRLGPRLNRPPHPGEGFRQTRWQGCRLAVIHRPDGALDLIPGEGPSGGRCREYPLVGQPLEVVAQGRVTRGKPRVGPRVGTDGKQAARSPQGGEPDCDAAHRETAPNLLR